MEKSPEVFEKGKFFAGLNKAVKLIKGGKALKVYLATDADGSIKSQITALCTAKGVELVSSHDKKSLGKLCEISVGCAVAVLVGE